MSIDFTAPPKPPHLRTIERLEAFAAGGGMGGPQFQSQDQMMAWRNKKLVVLQCLCEQIVGVAIPKADAPVFVRVAIDCLERAKVGYSISDPRDANCQMIDSTIAWLKTHYPMS